MTEESLLKNAVKILNVLFGTERGESGYTPDGHVVKCTKIEFFQQYEPQDCVTFHYQIFCGIMVCKV